MGKITGVHPFKILRKSDLAYQVFRENGRSLDGHFLVLSGG